MPTAFLKFYFLLSSIKIEESISFVQISDFRFLMDLHVLGCPEHDLSISGKCLSVCESVYVCVRHKFRTSVAQKLINRISWKILFNVILTKNGVY